MFDPLSLDIVYSSHTLEHAYWPDKVVKEFHRILKLDGKLFVVLPYPDSGNNAEAHGAKYELGTTTDDGGAAVMTYFTKRGFSLEFVKAESFREPEIWLEMKKGQ
jgi:SAM-dependent methyltransferase